MSAKQSVLLLGATGETGRSVLDGLLEDGNFDVKLLVRKASLEKPAVQEFRKQGLEIRVGDPAEGAEALVPLMKGIHTVISTIDALSQRVQLPMVEAAKKAGIKRFVPCAFITVCPPGGVLKVRDEKQIVYQEIWKARIPYTIIDVGFWHQISFPSIPSGRVEYATFLFRTDIITGDGEAPNLLTDERDMGRYVARIIKDERTLNKFVATYSDALSQNEIWAMMEEMSGEKIERKYETGESVLAGVDEAFEKLKTNPGDLSLMLASYGGQYKYSKYIRGDNSPEMAKYLGYLDAGELYPDFKPIKFREYLKELLDGKARKPYPHWT